MYMDENFGAWQVGDDKTKGKVQFKLFFPDRAADSSQYSTEKKSETYGDPQIVSIQVVGDFMNHLNLPDWDPNQAPQLSKQKHPKGWVWSYTSSQKLPADFYEYKYYVTFANGQKRWVGDPCTRYGGKSEQNSAVVIGGSTATENTVLPVAGGRKPLRDHVLYELMIDDFTDEYRGFRAPLGSIQDKLDYLQQLGITAILFMPWTAWPGDGFSWGYTPHQYFSIEYRYTNALNAPAEKLSWLKKLITACHERGIHVIMDGVFNHAGDTNALAETAHGFPYRWLYQNPEDCPYAGIFGGKFPGLLDLDYHNGCTQEFIRDVCFYWIDQYGIDGIRFDNTTNFYIKDINNGLPQLITDIREHVADPNFSLTLEHIDISAANVTQSTGADSYWNNELYARTFEGLWWKSISPGLLRALDSHVCLGPDNVATTYLSNHDHSHVAWRAGAESNQGALAWYRLQPYVIALLTAPGCPMIQNGQEYCEDYWIMENDNGTGRRVQPRPLRWSFCNDSIGKAMRDLYTKLIAIRKTYAGLRSNDLYPTGWENWMQQFNNEGYGVDTSKGLLIFHRWGCDEHGKCQRFIIVLNFSDHTQTADISFPEDGQWQDLLNDATVTVNGYRLRNTPVNSHWGHVYYR